MPRTRSLAWSELKIGVMAIAAMALNAAADARHLYESLGYFEAPSPMMFKMM